MTELRVLNYINRQLAQAIASLERGDMARAGVYQARAHRAGELLHEIIATRGWAKPVKARKELKKLLALA